MNYYRDYHTLSRSSAAELDFQTRLGQFLGEIGLPSAAAMNIASTTGASMKGLTYHSHAHILSIFDWVKEQAIDLEPWQALALWFHDVIYDLKAPPGQNEDRSAQFAQQVLSGHIESQTLSRICQAIRCTARHLEKLDFDFRPGVTLVLDLDICMFAWNRQNYAAAARLVAEEYQTIYSASEYASGQKRFLAEFKSKGFIFRTPAMRPHEATALDNIDWELAALG